MLFHVSDFWYRLFHDGVNYELANECLPLNSCGTQGPVWMIGNYPDQGNVPLNSINHILVISLEWQCNLDLIALVPQPEYPDNLCRRFSIRVFSVIIVFAAGVTISNTLCANYGTGTTGQCECHSSWSDGSKKVDVQLCEDGHGGNFYIHRFDEVPACNIGFCVKDHPNGVNGEWFAMKESRSIGPIQ